MNKGISDIGSEIKVEVVSDPEDATTASAICVEAFTETFGHLYKPEDLSAYLRDKCGPEIFRRALDDRASRLWFARDTGGNVVGYTLAAPCDLPVDQMPENAGELSRLYVRQSHQGSGLGVKLLETALSWLDAKFNHIYLSVYAENHGAQRLYARYGFEKIQKYYYMVGNHPDPEFIMRKAR